MLAKVVLEKYLAFSGGILDYQVPDNLINQIKIGQLVEVPFQKKTYHALVVALIQTPPDEEERNKQNTELRAIKALLSEEILLTDEQILISQEIADYYLCSIAQVIQLFLPKNIWKNRIHKPQNIHYIFNSEFDKNQVKIKGENQLALLAFFEKNPNVSSQTLRSLGYFRPAVLKKFLEKEIVIQAVSDLAEGILKVNQAKLKALNLEQKEAYQTILNSTKPVLLHGITGSGKTEVYLQVIQHYLEAGKSALLLVPEIVLTPQIVEYFKNVFGEAVAVIHSRLSDGEKERTWWEIKSKQKRVVIGSRSALFYPYPDLGVVILDEAHEWTYKSDQTPRYHAEKVAEIFCRYAGAKLILGTATPSVENYYQATKNILNAQLSAEKKAKREENNYELVVLQKRIYEDEIEGVKITKESILPQIEIIDLKAENQKKNFSPISDLLYQEIKTNLKNGEQSLLFLNKRGTASSVMCRECGYTLKCKACDVSLTYHEKAGKGKLMCHYCGRMENPIAFCPHCQSPQLKFAGIGTQKVVQELAKLFPQARIERADRDTTSNKDSHLEIYTKLKNGDIDILVGTQLITKSFDLPKVSLVGVLQADVGLNIPDFRSGEKIFQLLTQVAGRAGRRAKKGRVILQTYNPDNFIFNAVQKHDYQLFYQNEINIRKELKLPPFSEMIKLTYVDSSLQKVLEKVDNLKKFLIQKTKDKNIQVLSAPALIPKLHNKYHWNIILKGESPDKIIRDFKIPFGWRIDRDPIQTS